MREIITENINMRKFIQCFLTNINAPMRYDTCTKSYELESKYF